MLGCKEDEILMCSAKTGEGVKEILDEVIKKVPAPLTNTVRAFSRFNF